MSERVNGRSAASQSIARMCAVAKTASVKTITLYQVISQITLLNGHWTRFCDHHDAVLAVTGKNQIEEQLALFTPTEDAYAQALSVLMSLKATHEAVASARTTQPVVQATAARAMTHTSSLPKITLPKFSDGYLEWQSFADLYKVMVHDHPTMTNVERFHYLRTSLTGEAERIISHIAITADNYNVAWKALEERYTNQRIISTRLIEKLVTQPAASETVTDIKQLLDTTKQSIEMLANLKRPVSTCDDFIVYIVANKLPKHSRHLWETEIADKTMPATWDQLATFLTTRFRTLEASSGPPPNQDRSTGASSKVVSKKHNLHITAEIKCIVCGECHYISRCPSFAAETVTARRQHAREKRLCFNCLQPNHSADSCPSKHRCHSCHRQHHTLLHQAATTPSINSETRTTTTNHTTPSPPTINHAVNHHVFENRRLSTSVQQTVLLATAQARAKSSRGNIEQFRVLIDTGSQISLITEAAANLLQWKRRKSYVRIHTVGSSEPIAPSGVITGPLSSSHDNKSIVARLHILPTITSLLPSTDICFDCNVELPTPLADPLWHRSSPVEVLLGADSYHKLIEPGTQKLNDNTILAQNSAFGWILTGEMTTHIMNPSQSCSHITINESIDNLLRNFWEIADNSTEELSHSAESKFIEKHFVDTHNRLSSGRYQVRLPFRSLMTGTPEMLGDSLSGAISRLHQVERRLQHDPDRYKEYIKFMDNYEQSNHMKEIPANEINKYTNGVFYLPHHSVIKQSSTTTKLRVVFDGSAKSNTGTSINNAMITGPTIQGHLADILLRWRNKRIAISADIRQMYRQVAVHPNDQDYQRIVWRRSPHDEIKHYRLLTVTYGLSSSPFLAIRPLRQLAADESDTYPLASQATLSDFYVDDFLSGADDIATATQLTSEMTKLLHSGCMELVKWASNSGVILATIPEADRQCKYPLTLSDVEPIATLGINWDPADDSLGFRINVDTIPNEKLTKRQLLSQASRMFDPIGWLEPVTITPKLMMQQLWLLKLEWDDPIPESMNREWTAYRTNLNRLAQLKIHRWTGFTANKSYQLHGFSDASARAYAAVVYLRVCDHDEVEKPIVSILTARSRVSPIKTVSIPRLELCGVALLADLMHRVINTIFATSNVQTFAWCDSQITLAWLQSPPARWKVFISNRTSRILDKLPSCRFGYIRSADNPADVASRGTCPTKIINNRLWWHGPSWLTDPPSLWPTNTQKINVDSCKIEERIIVNAATVIPEWDLLSRYSSLTRLIRITALCLRFISKLKTSAQKPEFLTSLELNAALQAIITNTQRTHLSDTIRGLENVVAKPAKVNLAALDPFIDVQGLLRVGGRLRRADMRYSQRHPIILPRQSRLTRLITHHAHHQTLHGNVQIMLNVIRLQYWIIGARSAVKQTIRECVVCVRMQAKIVNPFMSDLPAIRVNPSYPFMHTAIDYAGPTLLRQSNSRGRKQLVKGYISVFVCMATKAIHLEAVSDLTSVAFIASFRRFISRRGKCSDVYSDNGTNFVGADRILNEYRAIAKQSAPLLATDGIGWHFSPPSGPHFNGLAEAGVKSMKRHLTRVVGTTPVTYEELSTILCQIEACLNSRPLCSLKDDPSQLAALTPGHFLVGRPLLSPPEPNILDRMALRNRWNLIQQLVQSFWARWQHEYLTELQQRVKWTQHKPDPKVGDVVIIREEGQTPLRWPMGRIIEIHPGLDGTTRVVTLKTSTGTLKRPVVKLCWLPTQSD